MRSTDEVNRMAARFGAAYRSGVEKKYPEEVVAHLSTVVAVFGWVLEVPEAVTAFRLLEVTAEAVMERDKANAALLILQNLLEIVEKGESHREAVE